MVRPLQGCCEDATAASGRATGWHSYKSFRIFVAQTRGEALETIQRIVLDRAVAEELVQELFLYAWQNAPLFESRPIAERHRALRHTARLQARLARAALRQEERDRARASLYAPTPAVSDLGASRYLVTPERLRTCLASLKPAERQTLCHAFGADLTHAEVAACMQVPLGTVKAWLRRGLHKLRYCLKDNLDNGGPHGCARCDRTTTSKG